ncbi:MAG: hypothetical protein M3063_09570 [Actinomycetota bacterium]|nr:hypothetical protein [Actinomycetota bacterium]
MPAKMHGVLDFASAFALIAFALVVGGSDVAVATGVTLGIVLIVVSVLTDYPLGVIKVIPFKVHSAGDYVGAASLIAAPFILGFVNKDKTLSFFYIATGIALIAVSLVTNYDDTGRTAQAQVK